MSDLSDLLTELGRLKMQVSGLAMQVQDTANQSLHSITKMQSAVAAAIAAQNAPTPTPQSISPAGTKAQVTVSPGPVNPNDGRSRREVTMRQQSWIKDLCEQKFARVTPQLENMLQASQVIDKLTKLPDVPEHERDMSTRKFPLVDVAYNKPVIETVTDKINLNVLRIIPDGRYAVTADDGKQTVFLKLSTRKRADKSKPYRDLRVKSADSWNELQRFYDDGTIVGRNTVHGSVVADLLTQIMMDKGGCADRYGERFQECVNCGRELTDDRSRYYRLGSECIQNRHDVVEYVDKTRGPWTPGAASQD